jgi:glycosyl transferase family 25
MDFKEVIKRFVNEVDDTKVGFFMIHLDKAKERMAMISELSEKLHTTIPIFPAVDGYKLLEEGHPTACAHRNGNGTRGAGDIGCTVSHVRICKEGLKRGLEYGVVFEDDCVLNQSYENLIYYIENSKHIFDTANISWDLFLLGNNAHINNFRQISPLHVKVNDFYGTTAYIMNKKFMQEISDLYDNTLAKGQIHSADGLFSAVLQTNYVNAYACIQAEHFFIQKKGAYSYVIEGVR